MEVKGQKPSAGAGSRPHCQPCHRDGENQAADGYCRTCGEHLCQTCIKFHKRNKASANHVLLDRNSMPKSMSLSKSHGPNGCVVPCPKHGDKMIEFLCHQHEEVVCYICATTDHGACAKDYIPDISDQYVKRSEFVAKTDDVRSVHKFCIQREDDVNKLCETLTNSCIKANKDVDEFRHEIDSALDRWQSELKATIEERKNNNINKLTNLSDETASCEKDVSDILTRIDSLESSGENDRLLVEVIQAMPHVKNHRDTLDKQSDIDIVSTVSFDKNKQLHTLFSQQNGFGIINERKDKLYKLPVIQDTVTKKSFTFEKEINIKTKDDKGRCWITGIAELSPGSLILTDHDNKAAKIVSTRTSTVTSRLQLTSEPWDITVLPDLQQAAVTLCEKETIQFLSTDRGLREDRRMKVNGFCYGITYARGRLVVTHILPGKCEILSLQGDVLFSYPPDIGLSGWPYYVITSNDGQYVFISDRDNHRVVKLEWKGKLVGEYKDEELRSVFGLQTCPDGTFYVCSSDTHMIHHVTADCKKKTVVLKEEDGIRGPTAVCYSREGALYVSCVASKDEYDNFLKVYK